MSTEMDAIPSCADWMKWPWKQALGGAQAVARTLYLAACESADAQTADAACAQGPGFYGIVASIGSQIGSL
jgi:hypothetical protein